MIRVCHIVDVLNVGGLERTVIEIVRNLKGYEHHVWCLKERGRLSDELNDSNVCVREFGYSGGLNILSLFALSRELKRNNFQIVHCHGLYPSIWGRLAAIFAGVRVRIAHCQNLYYGIALKERIKLWLLGYWTSRIIAVSEAVKESLVRFIGIQEKKITVIYNSASAVDPVELKSKRKAVRQELGFGENDFVVGSIGRLQEHKGHSYLLEAIAQCRDEGIMCKGVIAGEGPERAHLEEKIKELNLSGQVVLLGLRMDVENILSSIDVLAQPSTVREGLPLVLAEGAAAGLPLIATTVGGNPEIVRDGINGLLVPEREPGILSAKIKFLALTPAKARMMGENSRRIWQEKFDLGIMLKRIDLLYRCLLANDMVPHG